MNAPDKAAVLAHYLPMAAEAVASAARFPEVSCSQCGKSFGPGNSGFSHCSDHAAAPRNHTADYSVIALQAATPRMSDIDRRTRHLPSGTVNLTDDIETDARWSYGDSNEIVLEAVKVCGVWCDPYDVLRDTVIECITAELLVWLEEAAEEEETLATMRSGPL